MDTPDNSYRGIVTFIDVHRRKLNAAFGLKWRRAPAHTTIRYILKGLDPAEVETVFRQHAALLQAACAKPGQASIALDGKTLRGSFDNFNDRAAAQVLSAFATDTSLVLAHVDIAEKSNEIPAAQTLLAELGVQDGAIVTLDAIHCQKNIMWTAPGEQRLSASSQRILAFLHRCTQRNLSRKPNGSGCVRPFRITVMKRALKIARQRVWEPKAGFAGLLMGIRIVIRPTRLFV